MKKINNTNMEEISGGLNCFTVGMLYPLSWGMPVPSGGIIRTLASFCWNSSEAKTPTYLGTATYIES
tara:strand:+ start:531 stop:731 length:201 start_codon:yes stop_codon:yes gene_type:complete